MKKVFALALTAFLLIACLSACESVHNHTSEWEFNQTHHWIKATCSLQICDFNMPAPEEHVDSDENQLCDVCGCEIHKHTSEYVCNEQIHQFVYTCRCPYPDIAELHIDTDENGICDICKYVLPSHEHTTYVYYDKTIHSFYYVCGCTPQIKDAKHVDENGDFVCDVCEYHIDITNGDVAQIILNYEVQTIKNFEQENPNYEYFLNPVISVSFYFILQDGASATEIVNKHKMRTLFEDASIYELNAIKMIELNFERKEFTQEVHKKLVQIASEEALIISLGTSMNTTYYKSYMPKIECFAQNAKPIEHQIINNVTNYDKSKGFIIKSEQEYADFIEHSLQIAKYDYQKQRIESQRNLYGAEFFEKNALIITKQIALPSCSIIITLDNLYVSDNKAYVVIRTDEPLMGDSAMQYATFSFSIEKSLVQNVSEVITLE